MIDAARSRRKWKRERQRRVDHVLNGPGLLMERRWEEGVRRYVEDGDYDALPGFIKLEFEKKGWRS